MRNGNDNLLGWLILLGILVFIIFAWEFGELLGLRSFEVRAQVALNFLMLGMLIGASVFFGGELLGFGQLWPVFLALVWMCLWPALGDWADQRYPTFLGEAYAPWWAAWYTRFGGVVGCLAGGYGIKWYVNRY